MERICLIVLQAEFVDHASIFERAFRALGVDVDLIKFGHVKSHELTARQISEIVDTIKRKSKDRFVVFCPGLIELFLDEPDRSIHFSAYRSWHDDIKRRVIPHIWTTAEPDNIEALKWSQKPPLRVGFMGTAYAGSTAANAVMKSPAWLRKWFLRGSYLKAPRMVARLYAASRAFKYINTFPRFEAIETLRTQENDNSDIEFDLVDKIGFAGSADEKNEYANHLKHNTYILCPRGSENYSFRMYEALKFGRVPVIVDTDMVLPKEIDWKQLALRVPYESLHQLPEFIRDDYYSKSDSDFIERQRRALETMTDLATMRWVRDTLAET